MSTYPTKITYIGDHLPDIKNKELTVSDLADRLDKSVTTIRAYLCRKGAIERGTITDEDISYYLPDASTINKREATAALMARAW